MADNLLDRVIESIVSMNDISFNGGLSGIGFAINILHERKCIEGDIDDILCDIDTLIYKNLTNQNIDYNVELSDGLIGHLLYIINRFKNEKHKVGTFQCIMNEALLRIVIDKIEVKISGLFQGLSKDLLSTILWKYPILFYCLGEAMKQGIYNDKIRSMVVDWSFSFIGQLPYLNINRLSIANSLSYLNNEVRCKSIASFVDTLYYSVNFDDFLSEIDKDNFLFSGDWFYAIFNVYVAQRLMDQNHCRYKDLESVGKKLYMLYSESMKLRLNKIDDLYSQSALINGYSGIVLAYNLLHDFYET